MLAVTIKAIMAVACAAGIGYGIAFLASWLSDKI